jgi:hypothetical protein
MEAGQNGSLQMRQLGRCWVAVCLAAAILPQSAFAAALVSGDIIKLTRSPAYGGSTGGGEFAVYQKVGPGPDDWTYLFNTFCIEYDESVKLNQALKVGGISSQAILGGMNTNSGDPIGLATDYLYWSYRQGVLDTIDLDLGAGVVHYSYTSNAWADDLQRVIWSLEDEQAPPLGGNAKLLYDHALAQVLHQAQGVMAMNLFAAMTPDALLSSLDPYDPSTWQGLENYHRQDQLFYMPAERVVSQEVIHHAPEPGSLAIWAALGLAGIGRVCWRRKRRR